MSNMPRLLTVMALVSRIALGAKSGALSSGNYLFNLDEDPNEDNNLYDDSKYATIKKSMQERLDYWLDNLIDPQVPNSYGASEVYESEGGYAPWIETDTKSLSIKTKYTSKDAPNIVFVLADDWGWNDAGWRSNYVGWTTPNIDRLVQESVLLENFYSHEICTPTRGALMTGRFALRLGQWDVNLGELPLEETTLAHELKSAGYRTYLVGKWDLGFSTKAHLPTNRGFDYFYGYLNGVIDYWTKQFEDVMDLHENEFIVTNKEDTSDSLHAAYLFQQKAEAVIKNHAKQYPKTPMFMFYPTQLIHSPWDAPEWYLSRCELPSMKNVKSEDASLLQNYCALNIMFDEVIANLTCALSANGMGENTIMVIMSDNGGEKHVAGNTYPFKGHKGYYFRGGVSSTAIVSGAVLPKKVRGTTFTGHMHVTDWLPTLMSAATDGKWKGSYTGADIDGMDFWPALTGDGDTPDKEIVFFVSENSGVIQQGPYKYFWNQDMQEQEEPSYIFTEDQMSKNARQTCTNPNLIGSDIDMVPKADQDWEEGSDESESDDKDKDDKDKDDKDKDDEDEEEEEEEEEVEILVPTPHPPLPNRPVDVVTTDDTAAADEEDEEEPVTPVSNPPVRPNPPVTPVTPDDPDEPEVEVDEDDAEEEEAEEADEQQEPEDEHEDEEQDEGQDEQEEEHEAADGPEEQTAEEAEANTAIPVVPASAGVSVFIIFMSAGVVCLVMAALGIRILLLSSDNEPAGRGDKEQSFEKMTISEIRRDSNASHRRETYRTIASTDDMDEEAKGAVSGEESSTGLADTDKEFSLPIYQGLDEELPAKR